MLIRFNLGNFLSFKEVTEFSMIKGKPKNKTYRIVDANKIKLLKFAAVYGANASGKSNLISGFKAAQTAITSGMPKKGKIAPFKLDADYENKPSYFEFEILLDNDSYAYGFEIILAKDQIVAEWLIQLSPTGNDKIIFTRDIANGVFSTDLKITEKALQNKFNVYADDCKNNGKILFLHEMNREKDELHKTKSELSIFKDVFEWFEDTLDINFLHHPVSDYSYFKDPGKKEEVCRIIHALGTGITNYELRESSLAEIREQISKEQFDKLEEELYKWKRGKQHGVSGPSALSVRIGDLAFIVSPSGNDELKIETIVFQHGDETSFEFSDESDGTRRMIDLLEIFMSNENKVFVVDEIDRSLHPQLTYKFVQEFLTIAGKRNTQLIVTTHESRLLDLGLLRQDEVWIANKDGTGATELYSLDEYNVRFDKKVDKAYLEGRYGGVPIFNAIYAAEEEGDD